MYRQLCSYRSLCSFAKAHSIISLGCDTRSTHLDKVMTSCNSWKALWMMPLRTRKCLVMSLCKMQDAEVNAVNNIVFYQVMSNYLEAWIRQQKRGRVLLELTLMVVKNFFSSNLYEVIDKKLRYTSIWRIWLVSVFHFPFRHTIMLCRQCGQCDQCGQHHCRRLSFSSFRKKRVPYFSMLETTRFEPQAFSKKDECTIHVATPAPCIR